MLSHIPHGQAQAPYTRIHAYIPRRSKYTKILSLLYQIKYKKYYNKKLNYNVHDKELLAIFEGFKMYGITTSKDL